MPRIDIHKPSSLVTENYKYIASLDLDEKPPMHVVSPASGVVYLEVDPEASRVWLEQRKKLFALFDNSPEHVHGDRHQCDHCGAHFRYCAILQYKPTGNCLIVGEQCLENRFSLATEDFQSMRKAAELDREKHRIVEARKKFAEDNPDLTFLATGDIPGNLSWNTFIVDLAHKLKIYGQLSEKQIDAARRIIAKLPDMAAKHQAHIDAEAEKNALRQRVPDVGRDTITGIVLSVKPPDDYTAYPTWHMLVEDNRHFKLWGSIPKGLWVSPLSSLKGALVEFSAEITGRSDDDESFGFYKRPTKAKRLD